MGDKEHCLCDSDFPEPSICLSHMLPKDNEDQPQLQLIEYLWELQRPRPSPVMVANMFQRAQSHFQAHGDLGLDRKPQDVGGSCDLLPQHQGRPRVTAK